MCGPLGRLDHGDKAIGRDVGQVSPGLIWPANIDLVGLRGLAQAEMRAGIGLRKVPDHRDKIVDLHQPAGGNDHARAPIASVLPLGSLATTVSQLFPSPPSFFSSRGESPRLDYQAGPRARRC